MLHSAALAPELTSRLTPELLERAGVSTLTGAPSIGAPLIGTDAEMLPVPDALASLFPGGGLRRGSTITVSGSASLVLALVAQTSRRHGWCAEVGAPLLGSVAATEMGVVLERFIRVAQPGEQWPAVVASLLEAFDVVVVHPPARARDADLRRLSARARERSAVLISTSAWEGALVDLCVTGQRWRGLGDGHGYLQARELDVQAAGRGAAARPRSARVWLPAADGGVASARESAA